MTNGMKFTEYLEKTGTGMLRFLNSTGLVHIPSVRMVYSIFAEKYLKSNIKKYESNTKPRHTGCRKCNC